MMMKNRIVPDTLAREFRLLRNRIEAAIQGPATLLVTSASDGDGASLTAYGIAQSLSRTHQRTALVTTAAVGHGPQPVGEAAPPPARRRPADGPDAGDGRLAIVAVSYERVATIARSNVADMLAELRSQFDYIVIDGGDLPNNGFGLLFVGATDGVLISFRTGRKQLEADRLMLDALERSEAKVLGVVMNEQSAIDRFYQEDVALQSDGSPAPATLEPAVAPAYPGPLGNVIGGALQRIGRTS